ncbi:MAG: hypothetical protein CMJ46_00740 [Planctomyces sp.]|nr:hypothetical protein [Planctomyces sp.]
MHKYPIRVTTLLIKGEASCVDKIMDRLTRNATYDWEVEDFDTSDNIMVGKVIHLINTRTMEPRLVEDAKELAAELSPSHRVEISIRCRNDEFEDRSYLAFPDSPPNSTRD